ncbi:hypothetical protein N7466_005990 [Penicillium verhagenii]|uniref:uncharacterized protein n=1 Tax=Penicillium verhagenii TaxID=1562060 RepID=UPI002545AE92|nr:uncharacterized protein N7466_005990 [Penicillium verhagenii]KAJ5930497.1 hypothetical protein N7466_005990 [Penicillium verhagenii]
MAVNQISMLGGGHYNRNSTLQRAAITTSFALLPLDFSVSSATLYFNDMPMNDFSSLSVTIHAAMQKLSQNDAIKVFPSMVPRSYYQQILPDGSVDIGVSMTALHWLQSMPPGSADDKSAISAAAHNDLTTFLSAQHNELREGGSLILGIPVVGDVNVDLVIECYNLTLDALAERGLIDRSIISSCHLPVYFRSWSEVQSALEAAAGAWDVAKMFTTPIEHPASLKLRVDTTGQHIKDRHSAGVDTWADEITRSTISIAASPFKTAVRKFNGSEDMVCNRGETESNKESELMDELSRALKQTFLATDSDRKFGFTYAFLRLTRI